MFRWLFLNGNSKAEKLETIIRQDELVNDSREAVIQAARAAADAASEVTLILKDRLDESLRQIEVTNRLIDDAVFTCSPSGEITSTNRAADELFIDAPAYKFGAMITDLFDGFEGNSDGLWWALEHRQRVRAKTGPISAQMVRGSLSRLTRYDGTPHILVIIHAAGTKTSL